MFRVRMYKTTNGKSPLSANLKQTHRLRIAALYTTRISKYVRYHQTNAISNLQLNSITTDNFTMTKPAGKKKRLT